MDAEELYTKVMEANGEKEKIQSVAKEVVRAAFENEEVEKTYKTENQDLNVGEPTINPSMFFVDGVRVQSFGMGAGARLNIRASYYDTVGYTEELTSAGSSLSAGAGPQKEKITVSVNVVVKLSPEKMSGELMVMFTEGYS